MSNAYEIPGRSLSFVAAADLSEKQYLLVKQTAEGQVNVVSATTDQPIGILQNAPESGQEATVMVDGVSFGVAAETLAVGDIVGPASSGKLQVLNTTSTGADVGVWAVGTVLVGGATDERVSILLGKPHYRVGL